MSWRNFGIEIGLVGLLIAVAGADAYAQREEQQQRPPAPIQVKPLEGGVYWVNGGAGGNTGFVVGTNGVVVIDAKMTADSAKQMLAEIAKVTPKPVTHVILTHSDPDHVNGLAGFPKGLVIIAHDNCKDEFSDVVTGPARVPATASLRDYLPTQTVSKTQDMTIDGVRFRLLHFGPGHTSGDLAVYLPDQRIMFTGDILTMQVPLPLVHREKHGSAEGIIANLKGIAAISAETYVPGHGDPQTKADVEKRLADTQARVAEVKKLFAQGKTLAEVRKALNDTSQPLGTILPFTEVAYRDASGARPFDRHDLSGVWYIRGGYGFVAMSRNPPPMTPWAQAKYDAAKPGLGPRGRPLGNDPIMICDPMGLVRSLIWGVYPSEIIQTPKETLMLFDWFFTQRAIWTDGRKLPEDPEPRFYGYSIGHWEGDTFVVQSNGFDDRQWLDADGHPNSTDMRLEERYRRVDHDTIEVRMTLTDPTAYTQPWTAELRTATLVTPGLDAHTVMREDVCVPSDEAKYKKLVREPAGDAEAAKKLLETK
jgi:glyoxylase-like metal-dependent hydrolase (beta-lactamase superfamily II)